ncbi:MAG: hypothetical protein WA478_04010, partial [Pseudolabrys sp.]
CYRCEEANGNHDAQREPEMIKMSHFCPPALTGANRVELNLFRRRTAFANSHSEITSIPSFGALAQ